MRVLAIAFLGMLFITICPELAMAEEEVVLTENSPVQDEDQELRSAGLALLGTGGASILVGCSLWLTGWYQYDQTGEHTVGHLGVITVVGFALPTLIVSVVLLLVDRHERRNRRNRTSLSLQPSSLALTF